MCDSRAQIIYPAPPLMIRVERAQIMCSATPNDLRRAVAENVFCASLYFRLSDAYNLFCATPNDVCVSRAQEMYSAPP